MSLAARSSYRLLERIGCSEWTRGHQDGDWLAGDYRAQARRE